MKFATLQEHVPMNLRQLEVFRAVIETGSVTRAADRLHVTQPAASKMLAQFERDLGFLAFTRVRKRLTPTPEATAVYREVERTFASIDYLERFASDLRGMRQGRIVLGAPSGASAGWLAGVVSEFLRQHPGLSISMMAMDSMRIATGIVAGLLDVGITQFEITEPQVRREKLQSVEAVCVLHPSHRLARRSTIKPKDLQDEPFISLAATDRFRLKLDSLLRAEDISRRMQIETPLANAACAFVMQGMGIAMIDRLSAEDNLYRGIVIKRFSPSIAEGLFLLSPTRRQMSLVAETLAEAIRSRFRTL